MSRTITPKNPGFINIVKKKNYTFYFVKGATLILLK